MKKKITALVLVVVILAMLFTGMTLAYFTDTDSAVNVFTVGDVDIELDETVGVTDSNGDPAPDRVTDNGSGGATYTGIMPGNTLDKKVTVTNLENPAYVRVVVIVNNHLEIWKALDCYPGTETDMTWQEKNANYSEVFTNWGITFDNTAACGGVIPESHLYGQIAKEKVLGIDTAIRVTDYTLYDDGNYIKSIPEQTDPNADEVLENYMDGQYAPHLNQYERVYVYYFAMDKGDSVTLFDGLTCPTWFDQEQAEMFDGLNIEIYAAAIQQEGFATPEEAFAQLDLEYSITDMRGFVYTNAADLADALANAKSGDTIKLTEDVATVTVTGELNNVTIDAQGNNVEELIVAPGASLTNVTITNLDVDTEITSNGYRGVIQIQTGADVNNLVVENSTFNVTGDRSAIVSTAGEASAEVTITNCTVTGSKYLVYGSTPITKLTVENNTLNDLNSWVVLLNGGATVPAELTITGNTFTNCGDGIAKYLGSSVPAGSFTVFTNNTLVNCKGHDGLDSKWFTIPAGGTNTVAGNTLDGVTWIPGAAQGLN